MAETVTSLFGGHRQPADRPPASWPTVQPVACLQSFGYATVTSSAPSSSTEPARRDTDDSLTSYLRPHRAFLPHARAKKLPRTAECLVHSLTPSGVLAENHPKNRGFVGILRGQKCLKRGQKCLRRR